MLAKKRGGGGIAKMFTGWIPRYFTLQGGVLAYFDCENLEDINERTKPRGQLSLETGINFAVDEHPVPRKLNHLQPKHPDGFFIYVEEWKLAAKNQEDFKR